MISKFFVSLIFFIQATASAPVEYKNLKKGSSTFVRVRIGQKVLKIPLESYLMGVLPSEMPASWPEEALKAQVVASRSFVLAQMASRKNLSFDVESTIFDQVFRVEYLNYTGSYRKKLVKILEDTKDEVLFEPQKVSESAKVQRTYFHSDCGGSTETSFFVWRSDEPLMQVQDRSCPFSPLATWTLSLTLKELENRLKTSKIRELKVGSKTPSGRNGTIMVQLENGESEVFLAETFRKHLGYSKIRSTLFNMNRQGSRYTFTGKGSGHGVGMCQWGARVLASQGMNYKKILAHYFPLSRLENIQDMDRSLYARK